MRLQTGLVCAALIAAPACSEEEKASTPTTSTPATIQARTLPQVAHGRTNLRWKRFRVLQNDLARALELPEREVCKERTGQQCAAGGPVTLKDWMRNERVPEAELDAECKKRQGGSSCNEEAGPFIPLDNPRGAHVVPLGGNNPFLAGVYDPLPEPIVITPIVTERYVLNACNERAARDIVDRPVVFKLFDITAKTVTPTSQGLRESVTDLYKRLLARVPTKDEQDAVLGLAADPPLSGEDFARMSCFVIGTLPEFLFQ